MVYSIALCCLHSYLFSYKIKEIQNRFILIYRESKILDFLVLCLLIYLSNVLAEKKAILLLVNLFGSIESSSRES